MDSQETTGITSKRTSLDLVTGCKPEGPGCWRGSMGLHQVVRQCSGEGRRNREGVGRKGYKRGDSYVKQDWTWWCWAELSIWSLQSVLSSYIILLNIFLNNSYGGTGVTERSEGLSVGSWSGTTGYSLYTWSQLLGASVYSFPKLGVHGVCTCMH